MTPPRPRSGAIVALARVRASLVPVLERGGVLDRVDRDHVEDRVEDAVDAVRAGLEPEA